MENISDMEAHWSEHISDKEARIEVNISGKRKRALGENINEKEARIRWTYQRATQHIRIDKPTPDIINTRHDVC